MEVKHNAMRLLNTSTICLESFYDEAKTPSYAILSHTWGDDEVSFQDLEYLGSQPQSTRARNTLLSHPRTRNILLSVGYGKIQKCCERALADGLQYAWVDTCCIDKTSSAELSESINSMFKWYRNAIICYAYLDDIDSSVALPYEGLDIPYVATAKWFTRGWTLQELIAPREVVFLAKEWKVLGLKTGLPDVLRGVTGIDTSSLFGGDLERVSVAQRMSWAKKRQTTRTEDIAYCLLGIFDVSMPLLYGEGEKAFVRLQEEIMKNSDDQTLFAWVPHSAQGQETIDLLQLQDQLFNSVLPRHHEKTRGVFAKHPSEFSAPLVLRPWTGDVTGLQRDRVVSESPYMLTNKGIEISLRFLSASYLSIAVLNCAEETEEETMVNVVFGIVVQQPQRRLSKHYYRVDSYGLVRIDLSHLRRSSTQMVYLSRKPYVPMAGKG